MITAGFFHLLYKYGSIPGVASRSVRYLRKVPRYTRGNRCCLKDLTFKVTPTVDMQHCHYIKEQNIAPHLELEYSSNKVSLCSCGKKQPLLVGSSDSVLLPDMILVGVTSIKW